MKLFLSDSGTVKAVLMDKQLNHTFEYEGQRYRVGTAREIEAGPDSGRNDCCLSLIEGYYQ